MKAGYTNWSKFCTEINQAPTANYQLCHFRLMGIEPITLRYGWQVCMGHSISIVVNAITSEMGVHITTIKIGFKSSLVQT